MKTTIEGRQQIERYIIDCIDTSGYDDIQRSEKERLKFVWDTFQREYASHQLKYHNGSIQDTFIAWLQGLPSVFNIDFENHEILSLGRKWGILPEHGEIKNKQLTKLIEKKENQFLETWWAHIYMKFQSMLSRKDTKKPKIKSIEFTRINNDVNGNPRFVCHFLNFLADNEKYSSINESYIIALGRARQLGGRKFHNKQYGGGIVFQMYEGQRLEMSNKIKEIVKQAG